MSSQMANKYRFQEGERVLCFHGPLLYEAKCTKSQLKDKVIKYYVHYQGWNKSWDEWVPESRVLKFNDANLLKQKELFHAHQQNQKRNRSSKKKNLLPGDKERDSVSPSLIPETKSRVKTVTTLSAESKESISGKEDVNRRKRQKVDNQNVENEEQFACRIEIKIKIPDELKPWLVDDWDLITRQKKLLHLPARQTVDQILEDYVKQKTNNKNMTPTKESGIVEVTNGIKEYFNVMLGSQLLYKFERPQYQNIISEHSEDTPMSSIYGPIHLLRLFVKLGGMLVYTGLDEKNIKVLSDHLHDFLKFMSRAPSLFNLSDYVVSTPEYHRKAI